MTLENRLNLQNYTIREVSMEEMDKNYINGKESGIIDTEFQAQGIEREHIGLAGTRKQEHSSDSQGKSS